MLIIAGSRDVPGAALLAAHGAMRSGAGKLQIAAPDVIAVPLGIEMPEAMVVGHASHRDGGFATSALDALGEMAGKADAIVAGPGLELNNAAAPLAARCSGSASRSRSTRPCSTSCPSAPPRRAPPLCRRSSSPTPAKWPACSAAMRRGRGRPARRRPPLRRALWRAGAGQGRAKPRRFARGRGVELCRRRPRARRLGQRRRPRRHHRRPARPRRRSADRLAVGGLAPRRSGESAGEEGRPLGFLAREIPGEVPALLPNKRSP